MATFSYGATYGYGEAYGLDWGGAITTQFGAFQVIPGARLEVGTGIIGVGGVFAEPNSQIGGIEVTE
jgi:hypothetical protein